MLATWALWTTTLGRDSEEFWFLTPREVAACFRAYRQEQDVQNMRFGGVMAAIFNAQRSKQTQKVWSWTDFYRSDAKPKKIQTAEEAERAMMIWQAMVKDG